MQVLDPNWTPLAGYSHATQLLTILNTHDEDTFTDNPDRTGVHSHTPPTPTSGTSRRKEDATP